MSKSSAPQRIALIVFALAAASTATSFGPKSAAAQDAGLIPVVRVAPTYPPRTATCESGAVALRFTVAADGTTKDIEIVESSSRLFEGPAVEALSKWRYSPPTENGSPADKRGVQTVMRFERCNRSAALPSERSRP